jgi:hypothetical protein
MYRLQGSLSFPTIIVLPACGAKAALASDLASVRIRSMSAARWRRSLDRCSLSVRPHPTRKDRSMTISMYKASVPMFVQFLTNLSAWLD